MLVQQLGSETEAAIYFPAFDGNGNVTTLVNSDNGAVEAKYDYSPFGKVLTMTGSYAETNPMRFSTKYTDAETDLAYFGYRYYNPDTGRWLNRDPIEELGGAALYGFVNNSPVTRQDPLGLIGWSWGSETLGSKITRIFASRLLTPILDVLRANHYDLYDAQNEMATDTVLSGQLDAFYEKYLCSKRAECSAEWRPIDIPKTNAPQYMGKSFVVNQGLKAFWLSSSSHVDIQAGAEFRCAGKKCYEYRKLLAVGKWHDDIDANSFPGIAGLKGESQNVFEKEVGWLVPVIEGAWDIVGDSLFDTDFRVTVTFKDEQKPVHKFCCFD